MLRIADCTGADRHRPAASSLGCNRGSGTVEFNPDNQAFFRQSPPIEVWSKGRPPIAEVSQKLSAEPKPTESETPLVIIGWREWVSLPELGIARIKAKIDTGARSSCLHTYEMETYQIDQQPFVRFKVHPIQRHEEFSVTCEAPIHDVRSVRSSSGEATDRIVIQSLVRWMGQTWKIDVTLNNRSEMGFRMLIGREAVRNRLLVDSGRSYLGGRPKRTKRRPVD